MLHKNEIKFLKKSLDENNDPFPKFYLTFKVHKLPLKTRPIVSCSGSLLHPLGIWVDSILQNVAQKQKSYFKSSFTLLKELNEMDNLPTSARLFTADAVSMYTNIPTHKALYSIKRYLSENKDTFPDIPIQALMCALDIIMKNNIFEFGDTTWLQIKGTAMGTPPAPPYATIFYAIHEITFLDEFSDELLLYRRFIDDVFGIWIPSTSSRWTQFQNTMNAFDLTWEFSSLKKKVNFMDLTICIENRRLMTSLYEKEMNLYLYLPPHSAHPPGLISGMVMGGIFRIHTLCTNEDDKKERYKSLYRRLLARGWKRDTLYPLFNKALQHVKKPRVTNENVSQRPTFLFLDYNPADPKSRSIQKTWREHFINPARFGSVNDLRNNIGAKLNFDRLIIAYKRRQNLGNILSYRRLHSHPTETNVHACLPPDVATCPAPETRAFNILIYNRSHTPGQRRIDDFFMPNRRQHGNSADEAQLDSET
jgi:hypothetical protein